MVFDNMEAKSMYLFISRCRSSRQNQICGALMPSNIQKLGEKEGGALAWPPPNIVRVCGIG